MAGALGIIALAPQIAFRVPAVKIVAPSAPIAFWLQTTRASRCVDEEYKKALAEIFKVNPNQVMVSLKV